MRVKERVWERWDRLDKEHGIDWEGFFNSMKELDKIYWVTEKEELANLKRLGKQGFGNKETEISAEDMDRIISEQLIEEDDVTIKFTEKIG